MNRLLILICFALTLFWAQGAGYRLKVTHWSCQVFSRGALIQGKVQNISTRSLTDLRVSARVVGRGLRVATNSTLISDRNLNPGELASFELKVKTTFDGVSRCELWFRNAQAVQIAALVPAPQ